MAARFKSGRLLKKYKVEKLVGASCLGAAIKLRQEGAADNQRMPVIGSVKNIDGYRPTFCSAIGNELLHLGAVA
jgi:hypothetical protein